MSTEHLSNGGTWFSVYSWTHVCTIMVYSFNSGTERRLVFLSKILDSTQLAGVSNSAVDRRLI